MNEWSPGGVYRPVTCNQQNQMRSIRSPWDEQNIDQSIAIPPVVNFRSVADNRSRSTFQPRSQEEISKTSLPICNRVKKSVNGLSDPRFKRVISSGTQNDACVGTELKTSKTVSSKEVNEQPVPDTLNWNVVNENSNNQWGDTSPVKKDLKNQYPKNVGDYSYLATQEHNSIKDQFGDEKFIFNHDNLPNGFGKQSISDCTINTRNTSLASEDLREDYTDRLHTFSSTTRMKKVQNWIAEQKPKLDKRQSVITVIGQTQGQGALSSAFHEIDQRRKLVKELDKYAKCNKITNSEKDKEINTLVARINFLSPSGKLLSSGDKKYDVKDLSCKVRSPNMKHHEDGTIHSGNATKTENDSTLSTSIKDSNIDNRKKKFYIWNNKHDIKGKVRRIVTSIPYHWLAFFMIFISGVICWYTYHYYQTNGYHIFELFPQKPKTLTLYERICYWVWEVFRPSGNYQRSSSWSRR